MKTWFWRKWCHCLLGLELGRMSHNDKDNICYKNTQEYPNSTTNAPIDNNNYYYIKNYLVVSSWLDS